MFSRVEPCLAIARHPQPACRDLLADVLEHTHAAEVAALCATCPLADACLLAGLQYDIAWRHGADLWGAYGVWGGVWFEPGQPPRRIPVPAVYPVPGVAA